MRARSQSISCDIRAAAIGDAIDLPLQRTFSEAAIFGIGGSALQEEMLPAHPCLPIDRGDDGWVGRSILDGKRRRGGNGRVITIARQDADQRTVRRATLQRTQ